MQRKLIPLAMLGLTVSFAGSVSAQSSAAIFGVLDLSIAHGSGSISNRSRLVSGGLNASRVGFRGTEDLGGGMSASFWLEAGLNGDTGTGVASNINNQPLGAFNPATGANAPVRDGTQGLTFNRRSTVSLAGKWGELRVGRDFTPQYRNIDNADMGIGGGYSLVSEATVIGPTFARASNSIAYLYNTSGFGNGPGFYGTLMYYMGENSSTAANKNDGNGAGLRLGYANGPANVSLALSRTKYLAGDQSQNNIFGSWKFNAATLVALYEWDRNDALVGGSKAKGYAIGALIAMGAAQVQLAHSRYRVDRVTETVNHPTSNKYAVGYIHHLSKRTALYASYAHVANRGGAALSLNGSTTRANSSSNSYDLGVRHHF